MMSLATFFDVDERTIRRWIGKLRKTPAQTSGLKNPELDSAKILLFDIETAPMKAFVWGLWDQTIHYKNGQLEADWFILSWSAKWLFDDTIISNRLTGKEVLAEDDSRIVKELWGLLNEASIVIHHNGDKFDIKKSNTRFLKHGLPPTTSYASIDTLKQVRKNFAITSNRLDYVGRFLGIGAKVDTGGFELWKKCMDGDEEALRLMNEYCDGDVKLLEDIYLTIRKFIKPHPNVALFIGDNIERCPTCASDDIKWEGQYVTISNKYDTFRCNSCGSTGRSRVTSLDLEKRKSLLLPLSK